jgi:phosphatidylinositol-3-phosphatase
LKDNGRRDYTLVQAARGPANGVQFSDNDPDWHNSACTTNLASGIPSTDNPTTGNICPISGTGTDAATPAIDVTNEVQTPPGLLSIDGVASVPAVSTTTGKTIADQLIAKKISWKSYQEGLPPEGADLVSYSDGDYTNNTDFSKILPAVIPPLTQADVVKLYAAKHNPFVYFKSIQEGYLANTVAFDGQQRLFADLAHGTSPVFSFIVPNQCNDQHGRGNAGAFCNFDPDDNGTQAGLNPALIFRSDVAVKEIVNAIHASPVWTATGGGFGKPASSRSAIVLLWDENDYSPAPTQNKIIFIVDTNYGVHGLQSSTRYTHFSLLKSLEASLGLPCLNHACDPGVPVISDLFRTR